MAFFDDPTRVDPNGNYEISELTHFIRRSMDGHDVREALALGIEKVYDDATENDNANMEVKIARGTHPNLRSRLEGVDNRINNVVAGLTGEEEFYTPIGLEEYMTTQGQEWNI